MKPIIKLKKSVIPSCDVDTLEELKKLVQATHSVEGIGAYKIGFELVIPFGLKSVIETIRKTEQLDLITYRFLPEKYSTKTAIDIYGDRVAIFTGETLNPIEEDIAIFMMISQSLADSYRQWFQFMWDRCSVK